MYKPRHRRAVPGYWKGDPDLSSRARCINFASPRCDNWRCPRHRPVTYADCMARHATDSIGGLIR